MNLIFQSKAVGFSYSNGVIRYVLTCMQKNRLVIKESLSFKDNCKTALHRLQHLLRKYPSSYILPPGVQLEIKGNQEIKKRKDQAQMVKNKIDLLIKNDSVCIQRAPNTGKESRFVALKEKFLTPKNLKEKNLKPTQKITLSESLCSFDNYHSKEKGERIVVLVQKDFAMVCLLKGKGCLYSHFLDTKRWDEQTLERQVMVKLFSLIKSDPTLCLNLYGEGETFKTIETRIKQDTKLKVHIIKSEFLNFLPETGAALYLNQVKQTGWELPSFKHLIKLYKKPLIVNFILFSGIFIAAVLIWNQKLSSLRDEFETMYSKGISQLGIARPKLPETPSEKIGELKKILGNKKKSSPSYLFKPQVASVEESFLWLTEIYQTLQNEYKTPPFVLESFKYKVVASPNAKKPKSPYRVKVEMAVNAPSSLIARSIYNQIANSKQIVDTSQKIDWNYNGKSYTAHFFLKSRGEKKADV